MLVSLNYIIIVHMGTTDNHFPTTDASRSAVIVEVFSFGTSHTYNIYPKSPAKKNRSHKYRYHNILAYYSTRQISQSQFWTL